MRGSSVAIILALAAALPARAQYPLVSTMTAMDGQRSVLATCLAQDAQGLVWLGSDRGLFRTDGDRTDPILRTEGDAVLALCSTGQGVLAALASGVIVRCDGRGCDTLWSDTNYRRTPVRSLLQDARGGIWAGTYGGGTSIRRDGRTTLVGLNAGLSDEHVNAQCSVGAQHVAIATDQGIAISDLDGRVVANFGEAQGAPDNLVLSIATAPDGSLWAGTDRGGAFSFDPFNTGSGAQLIDSLWSGGAITRITCTDGRLWLGAAASGVVVCDHSQGLAYYHAETDAQGAHTQASDMMRDRDGAVWWCDGSTVLRRADPHVLVTPAHEGVDMRAITAFAPATGSDIAFASDRDVFTHANTFRENQRLIRCRLPIDTTTRVVSLCTDQSGVLWAGTFGGGVFRLAPNGTAQRFIGDPDALNDNVLHIRSRGDTLWFATLDGLYRHTEGAGTRRIPMPGSGFTFDVLPLPDGATLAATDGNGVIRVERDGRARILPGSAQGHRTFYSLCGDGAGQVWTCGPSTGIYRVGTDRLVPITTDASAIMTDVYSLVYFAERLFLFGDGGAFLVDPATGRTTDITNVLGLRSAKAELNASAVDARGSLWAPTDKGLFRLSAEPYRLDRSLKAAITSVRQGGEDLPAGIRADLPAGRDFITFRFTGIHFDAPEDVRFAYRLVGADTSLRTTRDRELTFSHLAPGEYRFEVFAFNGRKPYAAEPDTFSFSIAAPWWARPWAITGGILLLCLGILAVVRVRDGRLRARDHLEKVQARMEREKVRFQMQVLRSQVNPHFLFNSFNTLIGLIEEAPGKAVEHVEHLSDFFREILQVRDKELIPLREELRLVDTYFFLEQRRFGERIVLRVDVPPAALDHHVPPLAVQLLVENALKHNRATDEEPLVVTITTDRDSLVVGHPFRPRDEAAKSTGFGIDSITQRFAAISPRPVVIGPVNGDFVARIPLIPSP